MACILRASEKTKPRKFKLSFNNFLVIIGLTVAGKLSPVYVGKLRCPTIIKGIS